MMVLSVNLKTVTRSLCAGLLSLQEHGFGGWLNQMFPFVVPAHHKVSVHSDG
uniref:Uncharacterized protein n=1 Tax=Anguilla anguilla TaxID=7936 RepID=A0A0E9VSI1_ANGAN